VRATRYSNLTRKASVAARDWLTSPPVTRMTKQEVWVLFVFLLLVITGLAGKWWLRLRPPEPLPALPTNSAATVR
jgi:hypothetical protein